MDSFDSNDAHDEALWRLLGNARSVEASPYFSRKVLREIQAEPKPVWWQWFLRTIVPAAVCAGIAVCAVITGTNSSAQNVANADIEFETIQNLDLLVSNYESSIWLDPSSPSR